MCSVYRTLDADQAKEYVQRTEFISRDAEFAEKGVTKVATAAKRRQAQTADAEMLHLDAHLVRIRRERLRQFYLDECKQLQAELEEKGFSLPY